MSKFKIGNKVVQGNGNDWYSYLGEIPKYRTVCGFKGKECILTFGESENSERGCVPWRDSELELYIEDKENNSTMNYKVGDKVTMNCTKWWKKGDIGTIDIVDKEDEDYKIVFEDGDFWYAEEHQFELYKEEDEVEPSKFKVGDKVVRIDEVEWISGSRFRTIRSVDKNKKRCTLSDKEDGSDTKFSWRMESLKLYKEEDIKKEEEVKMNNTSKFKLGDKVIKTDRTKWNMGNGIRLDYRTVRTIESQAFGDGSRYNLSKTEDSEDYSDALWDDDTIVLYVEPKVETTKLKVGDKVSRADGRKWLLNDNTFSDYRTIRKIDESSTIFRYALSITKDGQKHYGIAWGEKDVKLYVEPKKVEDKPKKVVELTYVELLSYLTKEGKDGEKWIPKKLDSRSTGIIEYITFINKTITIKHRRGIQTVHLSIDSSSTYVREESKVTYRIYQVEHQESGKRYDFGREFLCYERPLEIQDIVVCSTKYGHTYGKIVAYKDIEMTEAEYDEYSKIIKKV